MQHVSTQELELVTGGHSHGSSTKINIDISHSNIAFVNNSSANLAFDSDHFIQVSGVAVFQSISSGQSY